MTSVHIINRLPSPVLDFKTPYDVMYKEPAVYTHMKIFGCLAFAKNPMFPSDKFQPKGVPCVFLGYPPLIKGYKLFFKPCDYDIIYF